MRLRALVVDDSKLSRSAVARAFQQVGCEVVGLASDGTEALDMYQKLRPDFVTMDLVMPKMSGEDALKAIKAQDPAAVVIVISGEATKPKIVDCVKAGATYYLVKPFNPEHVRQALAKCFRQRFAADSRTDAG